MTINSTDDRLDAGFSGGQLARNWWAVALRGALGVVFGLIALFIPAAAMLSLVLVFAAYAIIDGVFSVTAAVQAARRGDQWGMAAVEGVVSLVAGVLALLWPGLTVVVFVLLVAAWAIVSGGMMIGTAVRLERDHGRWWLVASGLVSVIFGALLVAAPLLGSVVLTWWLGAYAVIFGVCLVVLAFRLRSISVARR